MTIRLAAVEKIAEFSIALYIDIECRYMDIDVGIEATACAHSADAIRYDTLRSFVQKRLNRSICRLGCGLDWAKGCTSSIVFARWRQCALMGGHIAATWRIRLNYPSTAAMRLVKLLWPLVIFGHAHLDSRTDSRTLWAECCIVDIPHNIAI